jgi:hypothetical protein
MKNPSQLSKPSFCLPDLDRRLSAYALAASAAGVGMLTLAQPAEGKIIYTKAHKHIAPSSMLHLDLNHDGIADFDLKDTFETISYSSFGLLSALPDRPKNAIWGHIVGRQAYASALSANVKVGPKGQFLAGAGGMASEYFNGGRDRRDFTYGNGPWANVTKRYLGLKFVIKGKTHFGWARLNVRISNDSSQVTGILTGYAYETVANRPILTGKESGSDAQDDSTPAVDPSTTLGRLARGSQSRGHHD